MADRGEQTRVAMLEAGVALVDQARMGHLLAFLRPTDIAAAAGRSKSTFFHHWKSIDHYLADLVAFVTVLPEDQPPLMYAASALEQQQVEGSPVDLIAWVRSICLDAFDRAASDPRVPLQLLGPVSGDRRVHAALREQYAMLDNFGGWLIDEYAQRSGHRIRDPFTPEALSLTINALLIGMALRSRVEPERATAVLFADVVTALLPVLLRDADTHDLPFDQFLERAMLEPLGRAPNRADDLGFEVRPDGPFRHVAVEALDNLRRLFVPPLQAALADTSAEDGAARAEAHLRRLHDLAATHGTTALAAIGAEAGRRLSGGAPAAVDVLGDSGLLEVTRDALSAFPSGGDADEYARSAIIWIFRVANGLDGISLDRAVTMLLAA